ncbi:hypothetical protein FCN77_02335 [Arthrobacter sp. 24S4-2]|uniref:FAD/NAD(P)-binding protein n=1 Tax=Arthrobacter sp. 24S4-2 TaxID=2575374 RepID=UPI0010C7C1F5|nr:hypothetical protein FCN77_02335 [Arthrobacter sp. 24S4-2]
MRIALIGGGPTAVCVMHSLLRSRSVLGSGEQLDVTVFDPSTDLWCGPNYAPDLSEALTNVHAADMSAQHWNEDHISDWLRKNQVAEPVGSTFVSRPMVGLYFRDAACEAANDMEHFRHVLSAVTSIRMEENQVHVETSAQSYSFDHAVMCLGTNTFADPYQLQGVPGAVVSPYPLSKTVLQTRATDRVAIVGTGLAAIDVVLALKSSGHQGPITMVSRGGLLPPVRRPRLEYQLRHFTVDAVERLAGLEQREPRRRDGPTRGHVQLRDMINLMWREFGEAGASRDARFRNCFPSASVWKGFGTNSIAWMTARSLSLWPSNPRHYIRRRVVPTGAG